MKNMKNILYLILYFHCFIAIAQQPSSVKDVAASKVFVEKAAQFFDKKDYSNALLYFTEAYELSKDPILLFNIGYCDWGLAKDEDAIKNYEEMVRLVSQDEAKLSQYEEAIKQLKTQLIAMKSDAKLTVPLKLRAKSLLSAVNTLLVKTEKVKFFNEGGKHFKLQEYEMALFNYKESYRISPTPELLFNIGQCQRLLGKTEEAKRSYDTFLQEVSPNHPARKSAEEILKNLDTQPTQVLQPIQVLQLIEPIQPTTKEFVPPTEESKPTGARTKLFYGASAGAGVVAVSLGIAALVENGRSGELAQSGDGDGARQTRNAAIGLGSGAGVLVGATVVLAAVGVAKSKKNSAVAGVGVSLATGSGILIFNVAY
jgi:Tetratricopeptide repeat